MDNTGFSGTVRISAVDDFIAPSQDCIKPLTDIVKARQSRQKQSGGGSAVTLPAVSDQKEKPEEKAVQITINDCLACSGCVTTAEAVLIEQQSYVQVAKALAFQDKHVVVTLSTQSLASLAAQYDISLERSLAVVLKFFKRIGVALVLPLSFVRAFSLVASEREFVSHFRRAQQADDADANHLPVFSAACPGWVCFAEKTHGDLLLRHMSQVRSPQAVAGSIVKRHLAKAKGWSPSAVYHTAVMPCFDKKLEASRHQFADRLLDDDDQTPVPETDCVISSGELHSWMREVLDDVDAFVAGAAQTDGQSTELLQLIWPPVDSLCAALQHQGGGGSGGYAQHVIRRAAAQLFNIADPVLQTERISKDFVEIRLADPSDASKPPLLRFARAYGFRNIQNIVIKCKRNKMPYHYIEVMACPSGCVNGGGQLKPNSIKDRQPLLDKVTAIYENDQIHQAVDTDSLPAALLQRLDQQLGDTKQNDATDSVSFLTDYNALEESAASLIRW